MVWCKKECFTWNIRKEMAIVKIGGVEKKKNAKNLRQVREKEKKFRSSTMLGVFSYIYTILYIRLN